MLSYFTFFTFDLGATTEVALDTTLNTDNQAKTDSFETKINIHKVPKQYSYASFPKLGVKERMHFQFADLRVGVRFCE